MNISIIGEGGGLSETLCAGPQPGLRHERPRRVTDGAATSHEEWVGDDVDECCAGVGEGGCDR